MTAVKTLRVDLGDRSYPMWIGEGLLQDAAARLAGVGFSVPPVVVTNTTVERLHGRTLLDSLLSVFGPVPVIRIGDGERFKNSGTLSKIYDGLFRARADRRSWVLAFGGGVVGDIAGFAAATFMRGIRYVGIPTTLLAQVDSSVGGKVGINVPQGKNLVGAFHQPACVLTDTGVLRSLGKRELAAGLFEVIKCGAIASMPLLRFIERRLEDILACEPSALQHIILEAVRIKANVVARDEMESHLRMVLNFGHTIGHALEAATDYRRFKHGEAVAWGMIAAAAYSAGQALLTQAEEDRFVTLIRRVEKLPSLHGIRFEEAWRALKCDKKFQAGKMQLVLLRALGRAEITAAVNTSSLKRLLKDLLAKGCAWGQDSRLKTEG